MDHAHDEKPNPPVHLLVREEGKLARIGCGTAVSHPRQYTEAVLKASCKRCARWAPKLSDDARIDIWQNANDRLGIDRPSPWERERAKAARKAAAEAKKKARAEKRAAREAGKAAAA